METKEKILTHLSLYGKENKYRIARALKIDVEGVAEALNTLEKEGIIEIKVGNAVLIKEKKLHHHKKRKHKK